nr:hypothetical protein 5 [bacterium]
MIKIKAYKLQRKGIRGVMISLPKIWIDDLHLQPGDIIDVFRDELDQLILQARKNGNGENGK